MISEAEPRAAEAQAAEAHPLTEREAAPAKPLAPLFAPRSPISSHRARTIASFLLVVLLLAALAFVIKSVFFSGASAFPAVVEPAAAASLDFQNVGVLTAVNVYPGERVKAGQVIATQDTQLPQVRLAYDQSVLAADKQSLASLQSYYASQAAASQQNSQSQIYQHNLQIQLAEEQLSAAQTELRAATTPEQQVQAQAAITEAQTKLALAEAASVSSASASSGSAVAGAQAAIARDQAQIAADQLLIQEGTLTAPTVGVIASVGGAVGELVGPDGVISPRPNQEPVPVTPNFQLFPPAAQAPAVRPNTNLTPIVTMYEGTDWQTVAQVPQADIGSLRQDQWARFSIPGHAGTYQARITHIQLNPIVQNGAVSYDVLLTLVSRPAGLMPGMVGTVTMESTNH